MKEVSDLEEKVWGLISTATTKRDLTPIRDLTNVVDEIDQLKNEAKKIDAAVDKLRQKVDGLAKSAGEPATPANSVTWKVSPWDVRSGVLSVEEPKKAGLIPNNGRKFKVRTSIGQLFQVEMQPGKETLAAGDEIRDFYAGEKIKPGDSLVWTQTDRLEFSLEKAS
jgi:hypothetical protein